MSKLIVFAGTVLIMLLTAAHCHNRPDLAGAETISIAICYSAFIVTMAILDTKEK